MSAVAQGYEFAIEKPEEAAEILIAHAPEFNEELVVESQRWLSDQYQADAPQWGVQNDEVWERYARWMFERDLIPKMIDTEQRVRTLPFCLSLKELQGNREGGALTVLSDKLVLKESPNRLAI